LEDTDVNTVDYWWGSLGALLFFLGFWALLFFLLYHIVGLLRWAVHVRRARDQRAPDRDTPAP
jgi:hypothetical protein